MTRLWGLAIVGALLAGCTTPRTGPVDVTRYHLGAPVAQGVVAVEPMSTNPQVSPEFQLYATAVADELARLGFANAADGPSAYVAAVAFTRATRGSIRRRAPVSIGLGGASFGRGVGVGVGGSVGIGGGREDLIVSELWVQLRRRSDTSVVWEGRAQTETVGHAPETQPGHTARRLASALFRGFPGESGITITVK